MTAAWVLWVLIPQGVLIAVDEWVFHRKRGLPPWERWGHPLDTLTVLVCVLFLCVVAYTPFTARVYLAMALVSCLVVTKDEWVHAQLCSGAEHWLHAVLFILHPLSLGALGWLWAHGEGSFLLRFHAALLAAFMLYQWGYWRQQAPYEEYRQ